VITQRYRALQRYSYALALLALFDLARAHTSPPFSFGPMELTSLERRGLMVSGPDLTSVSQALAKVPGVVQVPA
jgi:hypothetical protein